MAGHDQLPNTKWSLIATALQDYKLFMGPLSYLCSQAWGEGAPGPNNDLDLGGYYSTATWWLLVPGTPLDKHVLLWRAQ